ncbi:PucR C-terminal helix-turn-helix domain-containing protein [Saccharopolyspora kobensis]|uniref:PucR C-terminal helix-turn-helix domain-containing protein n=1 Tax=Saccharopolyspora kobensis TaxID=146035 RepID=A0A1H6D6J1_9PSEU|nr:helix-turn-helix domain-containing protein [Saccharopolyspora kobensis]SEG80558.1 PucR C-terminal helix-turn-helix domain-containing protein [Saccharopolyspora kobensis]SFD12326.1 PucR C-terminal helix-turn-helix domain-containing protein [Saccharopolyspora kobensis]
MTISVHRLLAVPDWRESVRVLAGDVDRLVRLARPMAHDRSIEPGELVVVVQPIPATDWRVDALLRRIADAGGAGLLLPEGGLLESTRLLAERLNVALLTSTAAPLDLLISARMLLAAPALDRADLVLAVHDALGARVRPPEEVVTTLHDLLDAPVALLDDSGALIAGELPHATEVRVHEPVPQRTRLGEGVLLAHPVLLLDTTRPALWLATELADRSAARADVVPPALSVAAAAVQRWLLTNRIELERDARSRAALLADLLRLDDEPTADLRRRAADAGWSLGGWHIGIRIGTQSAVDTVARSREVERVLRAEGVGAVVVEHGDGWTGWATSEQEPTADRVRSLAAQLRAATRELRRTLDVHVGVGRPHPQAEGLATTIAEATDAARMARTRPESGRFLHVDQLGMAQLLLEWTRTDTFEPAARTLIAPLRGQPGDLIRTLAAYLDAESSIAETAAVLGVHRNTVAARIERIERLLAVDLGHRDERLALHLACRAVTLAEGWDP